MVGHVDSDFKAGMIDYMMDASESIQSLGDGLSYHTLLSACGHPGKFTFGMLTRYRRRIISSTYLFLIRVTIPFPRSITPYRKFAQYPASVKLPGARFSRPHSRPYDSSSHYQFLPRPS
jgi:hypothetical protein